MERSSAGVRKADHHPADLGICVSKNAPAFFHVTESFYNADNKHSTLASGSGPSDNLVPDFESTVHREVLANDVV